MSVATNPNTSRMLAQQVKPHPLTKEKGWRWWTGLIKNAEQVDSVDEMQKRYRDHIEYVLAHPDVETGL